MKRHQKLSIILAFICFSLNTYAQQQTTNAEPAKPSSAAMGVKPSLNRELDPKEAFGDISSLFENVVAVQRKALKKSGSFLVSPYLSFDFSDSPYTMYGLNLNAGYAPSEYWELYLNFVPYYMTQERSLSKKVRDLTLANNQQAEIATEKAKMSYGAEVLWSPAYGKDSWGLKGVIRSDTFFAFGLGMIKYETNSGFKTKMAVGKTFFISDDFNFRAQAGLSFMESITSGKKEIQNVGLLEAGTVYYF